MKILAVHRIRHDESLPPKYIFLISLFDAKPAVLVTLLRMIIKHVGCDN